MRCINTGEAPHHAVLPVKERSGVVRNTDVPWRTVTMHGRAAHQPVPLGPAKWHPQRHQPFIMRSCLLYACINVCIFQSVMLSGDETFQNLPHALHESRRALRAFNRSQS